MTGYLSDDGVPKRRGHADMSVFRDAVQDCLDYDVQAAKKALKSNNSYKRNSDGDTTEVEKFSGLRIRYVYLAFDKMTFAIILEMSFFFVTLFL